ncbi:Asp-tRNA(Asn)/Glu-tRNA(Gln) amidotransferase subunit GatB [Pedobacter sp. NJ-S-72]
MPIFLKVIRSHRTTNQFASQNGYIDLVLSDGTEKRIGINRIHMEEDAGKSLHDQDDNFSFVDLNRAGVPLIEIVTEPDIRSAEEASVLLTEMRKLVRHLDVGDGNMEEGSFRCDANISIRENGTTEFGTRCEVKNLNSIRNVRRAMEFEFNRQIEVITAGGTIIQSTLTFDADQGTTAPMRTKEMANDYRYFPDPDLPPLHISDEWLAVLKAGMPALPREITAKLMADFGLNNSEASIFTEDKELLDYLNAALALVKSPKNLINWLTGPIRALLNEQALTITTFKVSPAQLAAVVNLVEEKKITQQIALQQLLPAIQSNPEADAMELSGKMNLLIVENNDELSGFVDQVMEKFKPQVAAYKTGKKGVLGLFVGEVMKMARGKADPAKINELLLEKLK